MHDGHTLDRVGAESRPLIVIRPPGALGMNLLAHLARLPEYRDLLYTLTAHRIRVRYKQSVLGPLWALLQPLLLMLIFTAVFSVFARMPSEGLPYALFVYAGVLPWTFFSSAVMTATGSLVGHAYLVTKVAFPREMLPLSYVAAALFDLVVASVILMAMMLYYDISLTGNLLWVPLLVLVLAVLALATSLVLAALQVAFRDVGLAVPLLLQAGMFASPVIYPLSAVPERFRDLYLLNPLAGVIDGFRRATVLEAAPDLGLVGLSAVAGIMLLALSYAYFKRVDATVADRV